MPTQFLPARVMETAAQVHAALQPDTYPLELDSVVPYHYPLHIQMIPGLTIYAIRAWFAARRLPHQLADLPDRRLYGCMIAGGGRGVIFIDADASIPERRFTLAHEFSHYLLDHLSLREGAIVAFGESIRAVMDGERPPTDAERLEALRVWVDIQPFHHLMERDHDGSLLELRTARAEHDADLLALEILAPHAMVLARCQTDQHPDMDSLLTALQPLLIDDFGLPAGIARLYAVQIAGYFAPLPSLRRRFAG